MVLLYVKRRNEASRTEVSVQRVKGMKVQELKAIVAKEMETDTLELSRQTGNYIVTIKINTQLLFRFDVWWLYTKEW